MRRLGTNWRIQPKPTVLDGIRFPSKGESKRYAMLRLEEKGGLIRGLQIHARLPLVVNGQKIGRGSIEVDFIYERREGDQWLKVYEDYKAVDTRESKQRRQVAEATLGIAILVTGSKPNGPRKSNAAVVRSMALSTSSARG